MADEIQAQQSKETPSEIVADMIGQEQKIQKYDQPDSKIVTVESELEQLQKRNQTHKPLILKVRSSLPDSQIHKVLQNRSTIQQQMLQQKSYNEVMIPYIQEMNVRRTNKLQKMSKPNSYKQENTTHQEDNSIKQEQSPIIPEPIITTGGDAPIEKQQQTNMPSPTVKKENKEETKAENQDSQSKSYLDQFKDIMSSVGELLPSQSDTYELEQKLGMFSDEQKQELVKENPDKLEMDEGKNIKVKKPKIIKQE